MQMIEENIEENKKETNIWQQFGDQQQRSWEKTFVGNHNKLHWFGKVIDFYVISWNKCCVYIDDKTLVKEDIRLAAGM